MIDPIETAYVHIPFCKSKCFYCDFNSYAGQENHIEDYFTALIHEIQLVDSYYIQKDAPAMKSLKSVFFGGGTPSYVPAKYIVAVLDELRSRFEFDKEVEITIECNPGTVDLQKFKDYRNAGINRISIGLQSDSDEILQKIGRIHTLKDFEQCMDYADQTGLMNRNVDLMFGLPSQTLADADSSIRLALKRGATHISFYSLILENGTPFYERYHRCPESLPSEELEREMYWFGVQHLIDNGFMHYEISNLAKTGFLCKQNIAYWKTKEYLGFGAGAHSYQQQTRIENESDIASYIKKIQAFAGCSNAPGAIEKNRLTEKDRELEYFMLGFRLLEGVSSIQFERQFPSKMDLYSPRLEKLIKQGYLVQKNETIQLTKKGVDFANQVFMEFV